MADVALLTIQVNLQDGRPNDGSEFDLVMVSGIEGVSIPYSYEVTLFQRKKGTKPIPPERILNTAATIEINRQLERFVPVQRTGVFEYFEQKGTATKNRDFRMYTGRIVPPFKTLDREIVFRVFENQDVVSILQTCLKGVPHLVPDLQRLKTVGFPKMEYCVQFGESTFSFLSRLMARFGIHYFFAAQGLNPDKSPLNDLMVFGAEDMNLDRKCVENKFKIVSEEDFKPDKLDEIAGVVQRFSTTYRGTQTGNFNILAPTKPFRGERRLELALDLSGPPDPQHNLSREEFPAPFDSDPEAEAYARHRQKLEEGFVARLAGKGNNRTFLAGHTFEITKDALHVDANDQPEESLEGKKFRLDWLSFSALDPKREDGPSVGDVFEGIGIGLLNAIGLGSVFGVGQSDFDIPSGVTVNALNDYTKNHLEWEYKKGQGKREDDDPPFFWGSVLPSLATSSQAVVGYLVKSIVRLIKPSKPKASFSVTYVATGTAVPVPLPIPIHGTRPTAHGPHLATVIGDDGIDTAKGDISADAFGRVRVRFPWDLSLVKQGEHFDPFATGKNTCWVRVAQGWAGRNFGSQFLPRIGHEVVVEFIDGDPERPIITGSVYNADLGKPNLPFAAFKDGPKEFGDKDLFTHTGLGSFQRSGIKTQITPLAKAKRGFHMLRFDDTHESEQVLVRSQGRYDLTAFRHHFDTTHGNRHVLVKGGKDEKGETLAGASFTTTAGELDLHVGGPRYEGIDKVANLTVKADVVHDLQTTSQTMVGTTASLNALKIILEAQAKITLKVGGSFVVLDPCGVYISGPLVQINSGGSPDSTTDADITDPADAAQADPGEPPNFLDLQPKGGGGGSRKRKVKAKHGFVCKMNTDGTIQVTKGIKVNASDPAYASAVVADLSLMNSTKTGKALIDSLDSSGKSVTIRPLVPAPKPSNAFATPTNGTAAANGTGSDSTVDYNPGDWPDPTTRTKPPGDIILFHELTHADHNAKGTNASSNTRTDNFTNDEEFNTIGPENKYRDERGHPRRNDHTDL